MVYAEPSPVLAKNRKMVCLLLLLILQMQTPY
jgi:hypothetical protein